MRSLTGHYLKSSPPEDRFLPSQQCLIPNLCQVLQNQHDHLWSGDSTRGPDSQLSTHLPPHAADPLGRFCAGELKGNVFSNCLWDMVPASSSSSVSVQTECRKMTSLLPSCAHTWCPVVFQEGSSCQTLIPWCVSLRHYG